MTETTQKEMNMKKKRQKTAPRGENLDVDLLFEKEGYTPPRIDIKSAKIAAEKNKTIRRRVKDADGKDKIIRVSEFSYTEAAKVLGLKNANNISKWFASESLSFNTLKMIMYVLGCNIEDLIEPARKKKK